MTRAAATIACLAVLAPALSGLSPSTAAQQAATASALDLVGTWTLVTTQTGVDREKPTSVQAPRGLLILDGGGHVFEVVTRVNRQLPPLSDAQATFATYGGFWGGYRADVREKRFTFTPVGAFSPNMMGIEFTRSFELTGDRLTVTSLAGEPHAQGVTRWTWERVPIVDNLSENYRKVIGFWEHVVEQRINLTTGVATPEAKRAPSVIVYTPSGYVGVHFPPLDRKKFASGEPTDEEARAAIRGYVGYFGALGVYPGMVFHQILGGISPAAGSTLKRHFTLKEPELNIRFPPGTNNQGQQTTTLVTLRRLSGEKEMLARR
jgi:hypothetical protein